MNQQLEEEIVIVCKVVIIQQLEEEIKILHENATFNSWRRRRNIASGGLQQLEEDMIIIASGECQQLEEEGANIATGVMSTIGGGEVMMQVVVMDFNNWRRK